MLDFILHAPYAQAQFLIIFATVSVAYVIFGIAGFGTALVAGPVLLHYMPLSQVIPLLVLLDCVAAFGRLARSYKNVVHAELFRLVPFMALGSVAGIVILLSTQADALLLMMGCFVTLYAVYALFTPRPKTVLPTAWAMPLGVSGGLVGALFGSGGFLYAIYLNGRLQTKEKAGATQSTLIGISTLVRLTMLTLAGTYTDLSLWVMALYLLPALIVGLWAGNHITLRVSRETFIRVVNVILLASGAMLIYRAYMNGF